MKKPIVELIAETIGELIIVALIAWAFVAAFSLTWGQSFLISWLFYLLRDSIQGSKK
jgi:hypothetical protein